MQHIQIDVLVIGGGATGTGILRDLAMRGFRCLLVERRDLAYGTTGRYHGLLHSGGRYVVKDPQVARECFEENQILRHIMPQCIEDTGGFFVLTPQDDPEYIPKFLAGCQQAGIPVEEVRIRQMLKQEPLLEPKIRQCFRLPDASADSFLAARLNVESAQQYGGKAKTYHDVVSLLITHPSPDRNPTISGAICHDLIKDEDVQIDASMVVNASGAWAGKIARLAGINLQMLPGKGTMIALNHRVVNTVINRCKSPSDGDILVPAHTVSVMGTTDLKVTDPDHYPIDPWEIRMLMDEGEKIIPGFKKLRVLRAWAGVRPLIQDVPDSQDRDVSRAYVLLDHAEREDIDGLITITSGKWTTYRKMAQVTVDMVCEKLGMNVPCRTHLESLPSPRQMSSPYHDLGARLEKVEHESTYGSLVCECELVTTLEIERAIVESNAATLDDIRRITRLGMGPCQGAYCTFRAAGMLHALRHPHSFTTNTSLRDFLQERWKGDLPILWGQQLRQARFNELIYVNTLNAPALPGAQKSKLAPEAYTEPHRVVDNQLPDYTAPVITPKTDTCNALDVLVIGGGLAGLFTAWQASARGRKTVLITKGWGSLNWTPACIDIFGYPPPNYHHVIDSPIGFLEEFIETHPDHPYALAGLVTLEKAVSSFLQLCEQAGYPYQGSLESNILLPTALGTLRPSCLVPKTMAAGDASDRSPILLVGFDRYLDFYPGLIADNLAAQNILAQGVSLDLPSLHNRKYVTATMIARLFDTPEFRQEVTYALKPKLGNVGRVGFPAVMGLQKSTQVWEGLQSSLGLPVFEIPGLPPSIPGLRLQNLLVSAIERNHGTVNTGMAATKYTVDGQIIRSIFTEAASRLLEYPAETYVLSTGGILGGVINASNNGYAQEAFFKMPVTHPDQQSSWLQDEFLSAEGHPIFRTGVKIDSSFQPLSEYDESIFRNLFATGSILANCDPIRERSLEGIALSSGYRVAGLISDSKGL